MALTEWDTRAVAYEPIEVSFANNRPLNERPPIPQIGDRVLYRREYWDQHPVSATVVWVQDLNDREDENLWRVVRDSRGRVIEDDGTPRRVPHPDPWPLIRLRGFWDSGDGIEWEREAVTRESRMRGSPGWLPLNWRQRPVRLPDQLLRIPRPELRPANLPYDDFMKLWGN